MSFLSVKKKIQNDTNKYKYIQLPQKLSEDFPGTIPNLTLQQDFIGGGGEKPRILNICYQTLPCCLSDHPCFNAPGLHLQDSMFIEIKRTSLLTLPCLAPDSVTMSSFPSTISQCINITNVPIMGFSGKHPFATEPLSSLIKQVTISSKAGCACMCVCKRAQAHTLTHPPRSVTTTKVFEQ